MAEVFNADARANVTATALPDGVSTAVISTVAIPIPQFNGKASVIAAAELTLGAAVTSVTAKLVRNPAGENLTIGTWVISSLVVSKSLNVHVGAVDAVPDPKDCIYQLQVTSTGDASTMANAFIQAMLLSG